MRFAISVTLKEIAKRTGLSIPTVHQVLNGYKVRFSDETRRKVLEAAKELDYRPNIAARGLRARKTFLVGLQFNRVNATLIANFTHGFQQVCTAGDYAPILLSHFSADEEAQNTAALLNRRVDGLVANCVVDEHGPANAARLAEHRAGGLPVVEAFGRFIDGAPKVTLDYAAGAAACVAALIERGHRDILLLINDRYRQSEQIPGLQWTALEFWRGYDGAMTSAGLTPAVQTYRVRPTSSADDHYREAYAAAAGLLAAARPPTAVVCYLADVAEAVTTAATAHGDRLPSRFAVATFADARCNPSSAVEHLIFRPPTVEVGQTAARMLLDLIAGKEVTDVAFGPQS